MLIVTKTWFSKDMPTAVTDSIAPTGFKVMHFFRDGRGGGVSIVHRSELDIINLSIDSTATSFERVGVGVKLGQTRWNFVGIYRPPPAPNTQFFNEFRDFLSELTLRARNLVLCGDFNCRGADEISIDRRLLDLTESFNLNVCNTGPTGINRDGISGMLDLIFHNDGSGHLTDVVSVDTGIADHMFVGVTLKYSHVIPKRVSFTVRNMKKLDYIKLQSELQNCSFITCPVDDVDGFVDQMCSDVISVLDVLAPKHKTTKRVGKQHQFRISSDAEKAKKHRRTCEK